jgi:hypothetical protein
VTSLTGEGIRERYGVTGFTAIFARSTLAECLAELGEFAKGRTSGEEATRLAESLDRPFSFGYAQVRLGELPIALLQPDTVHDDRQVTRTLPCARE